VTRLGLSRSRILRILQCGTTLLGARVRLSQTLTRFTRLLNVVIDLSFIGIALDQIFCLFSELHLENLICLNLWSFDLREALLISLTRPSLVIVLVGTLSLSELLVEVAFVLHLVDSFNKSELHPVVDVK
jgi:hypothetical protein